MCIKVSVTTCCVRVSHVQFCTVSVCCNCAALILINSCLAKHNISNTLRQLFHNYVVLIFHMIHFSHICIKLLNFVMVRMKSSNFPIFAFTHKTFNNVLVSAFCTHSVTRNIFCNVQGLKVVSHPKIFQTFISLRPYGVWR